MWHNSPRIVPLTFANPEGQKEKKGEGLISPALFSLRLITLSSTV
jgi:hypothetical protein